MQIKAAVTYTKGAPFQIDTVELAEPRFDEILVKIVACGICHTDLVCRDQFIQSRFRQYLDMRAPESLRRWASV